MAEVNVFFEVEYWYNAFSPDVQNDYTRSKDAFIAKPLSSVQARVNTLTRKLTDLKWSDGNTVQDDIPIDKLTFDKKLGLSDLGITAQDTLAQISQTTKDAYPGLTTMQSPIHRFWGSAILTTVPPEGIDGLPRETRCLLRAIFYPCKDLLNDKTDACTEFDAIPFEQMAKKENGVYVVDGTFILGIMRWQAWIVKEQMDASGNPFSRFIGNGAGGGDRR